MAVIKRADAGSHMHRSIALDLGDLDRRAHMMREAATAEAERIVREAHAERARLLSDAAELGRAQGHAEGYAAGKAEGFQHGQADAVAEFRERLGELDSAWAETMAAFQEQRETLLIEAKRGAIELAVAIAERVVHREIEVDPNVVESQLREMLGLVTAPATLIVRIHPEDETLVREVLPKLREQFVGGIHVRLQTDSAVQRGSCTARTLGGASIDASLETQLDRIVRDLLPDRAGDSGAGPLSAESEPRA